MAVKFSDKLIEMVKECYPGDTKLHQMAEQGKDILVAYLCDMRPENIKAEQILAAETLEELKQKAIFVLKKNEVYSLCADEYYSQKKPRS